MKKERNCDMQPYPIYPAYPGMMPQGMMGMPQMNQISGFVPNAYMNQSSGSTIEQQLANMNSQINSLERRINNLESLVGNPTKYNNTNYQVM